MIYVGVIGGGGSFVWGFLYCSYVSKFSEFIIVCADTVERIHSTDEKSQINKF